MLKRIRQECGYFATIGCIRHTPMNEFGLKFTLKYWEKEMRFFTHTIVPIVHICNDNAKSNAKGNSNWNIRNWKSDLKTHHSVEAIKITSNYRICQRNYIRSKKEGDNETHSLHLMFQHKLSRKYARDQDCKNDNNFKLKWL